MQPEIAQLRVSRVVTVIAAGRILNLKAGRNQIEGAIVMGVGMALFEHTSYDERTGAPINSNLADYIMASNADTPELDVTFLDHPDTIFNELGARGIAEIGLAGIAAAITNAVHHATGVRVRRLPVMIEDLLESARGQSISGQLVVQGIGKGDAVRMDLDTPIRSLTSRSCSVRSNPVAGRRHD